MSRFPLFIAKRIYKGTTHKEQVSRPAVIIAEVGIAIGLAVMIISLAVVVGFKAEVRNRVTNLSSHLLVTNSAYSFTEESQPIVVDDSLVTALRTNKNIAHVQRFSLKPGLIKTSVAFQGMMLKGISAEYRTRFLRECIVCGEFPQFSDSVSSNQVVVSKTIASKLDLKIGDKIDTYFLDNNVRVRRLEIAGIYQTNFSEFDNLYIFTDLCFVNRLNKWEKDEVSGAEIELYDFDKLEETTFNVGNQLDMVVDRNGEHYLTQNVMQMNPAIFSWLDILDVNVWVILALMIGISGFTIISGLLIIIIEKTGMIGLLKSLGASDETVRKTFIWLSAFLIGRGMVWGNVIGLSLYFVQKIFGLIKLDPTVYYVDSVPVSLTLWSFLLLNIGTLLISLIILIAPSSIISHIRPADTLRFE